MEADSQVPWRLAEASSRSGLRHKHVFGGTEVPLPCSVAAVSDSEVPVHR